MAAENTDSSAVINWAAKYQELQKKSGEQAERFQSRINAQVGIITRLTAENVELTRQLMEERKKPKAYDAQQHERGKW